jgi:hypothetical protein
MNKTRDYLNNLNLLPRTVEKINGMTDDEVLELFDIDEIESMDDFGNEKTLYVECLVEMYGEIGKNS